MPNDALLALVKAQQEQERDPDYVPSTVDLAMLMLRTQGFPEAATTKAKPMGRFMKWVLREPLAATNPLTGNVQYNEGLMRSLPRNEIVDTMAHELTHTRQVANTPWYKRPFAYTAQTATPYRQRPWEQEAYGVEAERRAARRDIQLPSK